MPGRHLLAAAALVAAGAAALAIVVLGGEEEPAERPGAVSLVGDSLNVGIEPYLADELPGWTVRNDNRVGRPLAEGVERVEEARSALAPHVVVSLGTNDPAGAVSRFRAGVRAVMRAAGDRRCVVWLTIARDGDAYEAFNDVLHEEARRRDNLFVVDWAAMVREHPDWLAADGVHGTPDGYARRAGAVAQAVRSCSVPSVAPAG